MDPMMVVSLIQARKTIRRPQPDAERTSRLRRFLPVSVTAAAVGFAVIALELVR
ncbi:MAG TPA: hypothetical protein VFB16_02820 [Bauldia sp.]|nr:hypothetical protein [Bauldia sp.]